MLRATFSRQLPPQGIDHSQKKTKQKSKDAIASSIPDHSCRDESAYESMVSEAPEMAAKSRSSF